MMRSGNPALNDNTFSSSSYKDKPFERRGIFKERDSLLLEKLKSASENGLKVIFCIGESLKEKEENQTTSVLRQQLQIVKKVELNKFMIAYEPIWAIGTGTTANINYIDKIH